MRLLILAGSALALGACSAGGIDFGQGGYGYGPTAGQGHYGAHSGYVETGYVQGGHGPVGNACHVDPCAAYTPPPVQYAPIPVPPPAPVYPVAPVPAHGGCHDPCTSTYPVSHHASGVSGGHYYAPHSKGLFGKGLRGHSYASLGGVLYDTSDNKAGLQGRLGYQSASPFGAELEGSFGVIDDETDFTALGGLPVSGTFTESVDSSVAAFATARLPLTPQFSAHARVGYHNTKTTADFDFTNGLDFEAEDTLVGAAYGAGVQYDFSPRNGLRLDYTRYEGAQELDSVSLAYLRRF